MPTIAHINVNTNICENVTIDNRPASEIQIDGYILVDLNGSEAGIGYVWDEEKLVKPVDTSQE